MHIGLDFDNTIIIYDRAFHRRALAAGLIGADVPARKREVRDAVRRSPAGDPAWTELQGVVYGRGIGEAEPAPGVEEFLAACRAAGVRVSIISHKTEYPFVGERVNLRDAARGWLAARAFPGRFGIAETDIVFVGTIGEKLAAIGDRGCTHFVDDLPEVLAHPEFPAGVERVLFAPGGEAPPPGVLGFPTWVEIGRHLLGKRR